MLNGEYLGDVGSIEKYVDIPSGEEVFAEIIPEGQFLQYSFFIGQKLFNNPPPFIKLYLLKGEALVYIERFERLDRGLNVLEQSSLVGLGVTLLELGGKLYLSCDGQKCSLYKLPAYFENCRLIEASICGFPVMLARGDNCLCAISSHGNKLFLGKAESYSTGDMLALTVNFKGCAGYFAEREYSYNGKELTMVKEEIKKRHSVENAAEHFAFFEAILYGGDCGEYLSEDMQGATEAIKEYLGNFTEVTVPHKAFYDKYGDISAAALAYPIRDNLFEIKYFSVEYKNGKIDNIKLID